MKRPHSSVVRLSGVVFCAGLAAGLSGCKVGPDFKQPETESPAAFGHTGADGTDATKLATGDRPPEVIWWKTLGDPALDGLIDRAVAANYDLKAAQARVREARALRGIVAADGLPMVDLNAFYDRSKGSENVGFRRGSGGGSVTVNPGQQQDLYQAGFDASWELDVFGRVARNVEAADADIQVAENNRRDVLVSLLSETARNYVELRGFQQQLSIARSNIDLQEQTVRLTRSRFEAGLTSDLDVSQAEAQLASTRSQVPVFDRGVYEAIHRLSVLIGRPPGTLEAELIAPARIPVPPDQISVGIPSELLRRRPDIRRAESDIAGATARIGAATADLFPRFSITGSFGVQSDNFGDFPDATSRFWSIGPAVRWPIFEGGRIRANIKLQDAKEEQALYQYQQTVLRAFEEVENALVAFTREQDRRRSLSSAVDSNQRAVDLANQLYSNGLADFQRVLDSQRALFLAQDALVGSDRAVTASVIALYKALGGGWEPFEPDPAAAAAQKDDGAVQPETTKQ